MKVNIRILLGCNDNKPEYPLEEIKKKNISIPKMGDGSNDTTGLADRVWCTCYNCQLTEQYTRTWTHTFVGVVTGILIY